MKVANNVYIYILTNQKGILKGKILSENWKPKRKAEQGS